MQLTAAATAGAGQNVAKPVDGERLQTNAIAGMDNALVQAVAANCKALQQFACRRWWSSTHRF